MKTRLLHGLDRETSVVGLGAWGLGGISVGATSYGEMSAATAQTCLEVSLDEGVTFIDTAPPYGDGESERRIGTFLQGRREKVLVATKVGWNAFDEEADFSAASIEASLDASLKRLDSDYIDLLQLYNPPADVLEKNPHLVRCLEGLVARGKVRALGLSVKAPADALPLLAHYAFSAVQTNFNMLDLRALECGLLDYCVDNHIDVLARTPLCFGFLTLAVGADTAFRPEDHRSSWPRSQLLQWEQDAHRAHEIVENFLSEQEDGHSPASRAIRFCLQHPAVKTVLCGAMTPEEARENAQVGKQAPLKQGVLEKVLALYGTDVI